MAITELIAPLIGLTDNLHRWAKDLSGMTRERKTRLATYCDRIADTLARLGEALSSAAKPISGHGIARELGRLGGYCEDVASVLRGQLDGRKLAGLNKRLMRLRALTRSLDPLVHEPDAAFCVEEAEGYFRSLADRLRA